MLEGYKKLTYPDNVKFDYYINNKGDIYRLIKQKGRKDTTGYIKNHIETTTGSKSFLNHRLVAEMFLPTNGVKDIVHHKNSNKTDNRVSNLKWMGVLEHNHKHLHELKTRGNALATKLTEKDVVDIKRALKAKVPQKLISKLYNVSNGLISAINTGRVWSWIHVDK